MRPELLEELRLPSGHPASQWKEADLDAFIERSGNATQCWGGTVWARLVDRYDVGRGSIESSVRRVPLRSDLSLCSAAAVVGMVTIMLP